VPLSAYSTPQQDGAKMDKNKISDSICFWDEFAAATGTDGTIDEESQLILELKVFGPSDDWETEEEHDEQIALSWAKLSSIVYNASHKSKLKARCRKAQRITQFKERYEKYVRDFPKNVILFPTNKNKENP